MRELRSRNINDLVRYLKQHRQGSFKGQDCLECPVALMLKDKLKAKAVVVTGAQVDILRKSYKSYWLPDDLAEFILVFDATEGHRYVMGEEALGVAEYVRDMLRDQFNQDLPHAA